MKSRAATKRARRIGIGLAVFAVVLGAGHFVSVGGVLAGIVTWPVGASVNLNIKVSDLGLSDHGTYTNIEFDESWRTHVGGVAGLPLVATRTRRMVAGFNLPEDSPTLGQPDPVRRLLSERSLLLRVLSALHNAERAVIPFNPAMYISGPPPSPLGVNPGYRAPEERDFEECIAMVNAVQPVVHRTDVYWGNIAASVVVLVASRWSLVVAAALGALGAWLWAGTKVIPEGHCLGCGYDLRGTGGGRLCPECGKATATPGVSP